MRSSAFITCKHTGFIILAISMTTEPTLSTDEDVVESCSEWTLCEDFFFFFFFFVL